MIFQSPAERILDRVVMHGLEYFGRYYSTYRGIVVDNADTDNQGILILRCPAIGDGLSVRRKAYPRSPYAGKNFGIKSLPPIDSVVSVEFERGSPDMPLWTGGWWCANDMPEDFRNPNKHGWITPLGHKILLNEVQGEETIRIVHSNGATVEIDFHGDVKVTNKSGQKVHVGLDAQEAGVLGDTLKGLLDELFDAIAMLTVPTGVGPSGTPVNASTFVSIKSRLQTALSRTVVVAK